MSLPIPLKTLLEKFIKNPVLSAIFIVCFMITPYVINRYISDMERRLEDCAQKDRDFLELTERAGVNRGLLQALKIMDNPNDSTNKRR